MKLIHLSDLHLGRRLHEVSLLEDQAYILREILAIIRTEQPHAVLLCGDIYDKSVPPAEAVTLFDRFLTDLAALQIPTLIISGNHDSAERLAFGGSLMTHAGIHLSPAYDGHVTPVTLSDEHGAVDFWLLPFLKPQQVRRFFPEQDIDSYTDACRAAIGEMNLAPEKRHVLLCHQFVTGADITKDEEVYVGGTENVDAAVFEPFHYVALGHIHGRQNMGTPRVHYCGTPLKYSFSEAGHHKSLTVVELDGEGSVLLRAVPLRPKRDLREKRGSFAFLTGEGYEEATAGDYLHLILTDEDTVAEAFGRLRGWYPNALTITYDNTRTREERMVSAAADVERKSPLTLFDELFSAMNNQPMDPRQRAYMQRLIDEIWEEQA